MNKLLLIPAIIICFFTNVISQDSLQIINTDSLTVKIDSSLTAITDSIIADTNATLLDGSIITVNDSLAIDSLMAIDSLIIDSTTVDSLFAKDSLLNRITEDDTLKVYGREYFPLSQDLKITYDSNFDEIESTVSVNGDTVTLSNIGEDFKYVQSFFVKEDGIYIVKTHQYVDISFFIPTQNSHVTYNEPVFRIPMPLKENQTWEWHGFDIHDEDTNAISFIGKVVGEEKIINDAGEFDCLRIEIYVDSKEGSDVTIHEWLAPNVGVVKNEIDIEARGIPGLIQKFLGLDKLYFRMKAIERIEGDKIGTKLE